MAPPPPNPCKDVDTDFGRKLDMCLSDGIVKSGAGLVLGALASLLFLKKRRWPMITGTGVGIGIAYSHCELDLNSLSAPPAPAKKK